MVAVVLYVAAVPLVPREKFGLRRLDIWPILLHIPQMRIAANLRVGNEFSLWVWA